MIGSCRNDAPFSSSILRMSASTSSRYSVRLQVLEVGVASTSRTGGSASASTGTTLSKLRFPHAAGGTIDEMIGAARDPGGLAAAQLRRNFESAASPPSVALIKAKATPASLTASNRYCPDIWNIHA